MTGLWDLVKVTPPQAHGEAETLLTEILSVARRAAQVNEIIRSREAFRISNQALNSFGQQMQSYDNLLLTFQGELLEALRLLAESLERERPGGIRAFLPRLSVRRRR